MHKAIIIGKIKSEIRTIWEENIKGNRNAKQNPVYVFLGYDLMIL